MWPELIFFVWSDNERFAIYRYFYGSAGTRTRDLRRDRPGRALAREADKSWERIKGHNGHQWNEIVDALAVEAKGPRPWR